MTPAVSSADFYADLSALDALAHRARQNSEAALPEAARQFEALFVQMLFKSMRAAQLADTPFDSDQGRVYQDLMDQQLGLAMTRGRGIGLAELITEQLGEERPELRSAAARDSISRLTTPQAAANLAQGPDPAEPALDPPASFVRTLWPMAQTAAGQLNIAPEVLLAQAALETGWGKAVIRHPDGSSSFNLFGIKADAGWDGPRVHVPTIEYRDGAAGRQTAAFRAYGSYAESFADYVALVRESPRYARALSLGSDSGAYITALHQAGYATDPEYSNKIKMILSRPAFADALAAVKNEARGPLS